MVNAFDQIKKEEKHEHEHGLEVVIPLSVFRYPSLTRRHEEEIIHSQSLHQSGCPGGIPSILQGKL